MFEDVDVKLSANIFQKIKNLPKKQANFVGEYQDILDAIENAILKKQENYNDDPIHNLNQTSEKHCGYIR